MKFRFFLLTFFAVSILFGVILTSQAFAASSSSILVSVAPENPAPQENVTISLSSYASNLDSVLITWLVDGKKLTSGTGKKSFSLNAPNTGAENTVTAVISLPDGDVETRVIIRPSSLTLLWQANDSYVPPFYRGKALPTPDSEIKVVAMPEIKGVDSKNMTYDWKKDYSNDQTNSGYGKNFYIYTNDYLENSNTVSVVAASLDQTYSSEASVNVNSYEPKILFYKRDNIQGTVWQKTLTNSYRMSGSEIIEAIPYFISPKELEHPFLTWKWSVNNKSIEMPISNPNLIPLQTQSGVSGTSKLRLRIENKAKVFQTATKEINIEF